MTITTKELAATLGISITRVNELGRKGKIAREPDGRWDLPKVRAALLQNLDTRQASPARGGTPPQADRAPPVERPAFQAPLRQAFSPEKGTLAHAQLMHEQARAARAAMEAQKLEGKLIDRQAVELEWTGIAVKIRDAVMGLPARVTNRLPSEWRRALTAVIDEEARSILTALSDEIRNDSKAA